MRKLLGLCLALILATSCCGALAEEDGALQSSLAAVDEASVEQTEDEADEITEEPTDPEDAAEIADTVDEPSELSEAPVAPSGNTYWSYPVPLSALYTDSVLLVNKQNTLDKEYEPEDLVKLKGVKKATSAEIKLREVAADALYRMFDAAQAAGYTLYVKSGYRSYGTQATTYNNYLARNNNVDDGVVAAPGTSEHQTGLCCDILNKDYAGRSRMTTDFATTGEAQWMAENAAAYGFILRYPDNKQETTQIIFEPWHFRYVGVEVAGYIKHNDMTLEEFTDEWQLKAAEFLGAGGDVDAQIAYEKLREARGPESVILEQVGEDGDSEVSLSF